MANTWKRWMCRPPLLSCGPVINVIRGDMSLVGPRPHAVAMKAGDRLYGGAVELSASSSRQARHHRLGPGQWVARRGRYARKGARPVAHDLYYIEHWSRWLDLKILLKTVGNSCLAWQRILIYA